jgi:hypothetical protein
MLTACPHVIPEVNAFFPRQILSCVLQLELIACTTHNCPSPTAMFRPSSLSLLLAAASAVTFLLASSTSSFSIPASAHLSYQPITRNFVSISSPLYLADEPTNSDTDPFERKIDDVSTSEVDISNEGLGDDATSAGKASNAAEAEDSALKVDIIGEGQSEVEVSSPGKPSKLKTLLGIGPKKEGEDKLSFRQKLAKAGLAVALSYGAVSNATYGVSMSIAWYGFSRKVRGIVERSPIAHVMLTHTLRPL